MRRPTPLPAVRAAGATLIVALVALGSGAHAADLLAGKRLTLKDKANPKQDGVSFTYRKDTGLFTLADPTCGSSNTTSIQLVTSNGPGPVVTLPCANWKLVGGGFRYSAKAGGADGGKRNRTAHESSCSGPWRCHARRPGSYRARQGEGNPFWT